MSHAEHFLSRLVRLANDETKLALALYHDSEWVRELLRSAAVPDRAERVAVSLDDPARGPFVVVTRDGAFVTCLGRDMSPGQLPVLTRDRLDISGLRLNRERTRAALETRVQHGDERLRALLKRLFVAADSVSREDLLEIAAWEPLLGPMFLNTYVAMSAELCEQGLALRQKRLAKRASNAMLHEYWNLLHSTGHLAVLGAMAADRERYDALAADMPNVRAAFSYALTGTGVTAFMLKGAWAAGRLGKPMLAAYKQALAEDVALFELFDSILVLLVMGRRSTKLRAEISGALSSAPGRASNARARALRDQFGRDIELVCEVAVDLLNAPQQELDEMLLRVGARAFGEHVDLDADPLARDLALTFPTLSLTDGITNGESLARTFSLAAAISRSPAERLYLPRVALNERREPWEPEHTLAILEPITRASGTRQPVRNEAAKPGRNEVCSCGSGKKFKRCCGVSS